MKLLNKDELCRVNGNGGASYGAGLICGLAVAGTVVGFAAGGAGGIAMLAVTGSACGFSLWHADQYDK